MNTGSAMPSDLAELPATVCGWGGRQLLRSYEIEAPAVASANVGEASSDLGRHALDPRRKPPPEIALGPAGDAAAGNTGNGSRRPCGMNGSRSDSISATAMTPRRSSAGRPPARRSRHRPTPDARRRRARPMPGLPDGRSTLDLFGRGFALLRLGADAPRAERIGAAAGKRQRTARCIASTCPR